MTMEERAADLLSTLRNSNLSVETKAASLGELKSEIKQRNVPHGAIPNTFEAFRIAIGSQHLSLSSGGLSALGHLLKRLYLQEQHLAIASQGRYTYPLLLEKLGDHKERVRSQAALAFTNFWPASPVEVEHHVLELALLGKNPKAKETSITWLVTMTREHNLLFRAYVPSLIGCLEDADSGVREIAKVSVIELFQNAPARAMTDLRNQLHSHNVRRSITSSIFSGLGMSASLDSDISTLSQSHSTARPQSSFSNRRRDELQRPNSVLSTRSIGDGASKLRYQTLHIAHNAQFTHSDSLARNDDSQFVQTKSAKAGPQKRDGILSHATSIESLTPLNPDGDESDSVEPMFVSSNREIDDIFRNLPPHFEGRESEHNWIQREKSVKNLRRLTKGNAPHDYQQHYLAGIKQVLDGILKVVNSLRTTLSASGCVLLQEIARVNGPAIDPMVEILLQSLIKICGSQKKITAQNGFVTIDAIIGNVSFTPRIMQHIWAACQDKNVQPRFHVTGWLKTIMLKHGKRNSSIEHNGGLDVIEKCIKKGLSDPNPGVRESMRGTFWEFSQLWQERADDIMASLDTKSKLMLEKHPGNPNASSQSLPITRSGHSQATSRVSLKETIAAQKRRRLAAAKNPPPRPESAQSSFSDAKSTRTVTSRQPFSSSTVRNAPAGSSFSTQGQSLSSAPMRPAMRTRRPELMRPATADPYSRRNAQTSSQIKLSSPSSSPQKPKPRTVTTPKTRPPTRPKSRLDNAASNTGGRKPTVPEVAVPRSPEENSYPGPDTWPPASILQAKQSPILSPSRASEDFAMVSLSIGKEEVNNNPLPEAPTRLLEADIETRLQNQLQSPVQIQPDPVYDMIITNTQMTSRNRLYSTNSSPPKLPMSPSHSNQNSQEKAILSPEPRTPSKADADTSIHPRSPTITKKSPPVTPIGSNASHQLKVYEDPESPLSNREGNPTPSTPEQNRSPHLVTKPMPLEELSLNEPPSMNRKHNQSIHDIRSPSPQPHATSNENVHRRWNKVEISERRRSLSPRSKDPSRARDMIDRGLMKIRSSALDVHGYRKFQSLIRYHESILNDESKYAQILLALFTALEAAEGERSSTSSSGKSLDLKTQVLFTIRLMLTQNREYFATYYSRAMTAIITARRHYEITNYIVSGLEETAEDIVSACNPLEVADAVLNLLETEDKSPEAWRMIAMGSYILCGLIRRINEKNLFLDNPETERLGKFASQHLTNPQPDVRRAVVEFCLELYEMVKPETKFWAIVNSPVEDFRPILTYYIMRKPENRAVG
ncbi:suppressor of tub2 mutation [Myotisia sp. PD_48]|nr:suppressor of tub2 mutation [Myotisia sp. PD_48]